MSNKEYEYKFDTVKPPEDRVYDDRVMHYYENHSNEPARPLILALGSILQTEFCINCRGFQR